jgi:hypothetical protein
MVYWETAHTVPDQPQFVLDYASQWQEAEKIVYSRTLVEPRSARTRIEREFEPGAVRRLKADEFARVLRSSSPDAAFSFLSGNGADPTGRSRLAFARYKGEAEKALLAAGFPRVYIFRPAYIYPWSRGRNRISATGLCARSTPRFGCCSRTR